MVDAANPDALGQIESVDAVLQEIGCGEKPALKVFNKVDIIRNRDLLDMLETLYPEAICISAKAGMGLEDLRLAVLLHYRGSEVRLRVLIAQANGKVQSFLRAYGTIIREQYADNSVIIDARLGQNQLAGLKRLGADRLEIISG